MNKELEAEILTQALKEIDSARACKSKLQALAIKWELEVENYLLERGKYPVTSVQGCLDEIRKCLE